MNFNELCKDWDTKALAQQAGVPESTLLSWRKGSVPRQNSMGNVLRVANFLGVPVEAVKASFGKKFKEPTPLKKLFVERKLRQVDVAKEVGIAPTTLNRIAHGSRYPTVPQLDALARYFNMTPQEFADHCGWRITEEKIKKKPARVVAKQTN